MNDPRIIAVETAVPETSFSQARLAEVFGVGNKKIQKLFANSHIKKRHLVLPVAGEGGEQGEEAIAEESADELADKQLRGVIKLGSEALGGAAKKCGVQLRELDYIVCVTSTGFLCPGMSALLTKELNLKENISRVDVVGMGCNAAMNALQPLVNYLRLFPDKVGALVCVENCSAAYVNNEEMVTAVVNSLFGDGGAAVIAAGCEYKGKLDPSLPRILDFESQIVTEAQHTMRFDHENGKLAFFLDKDIPYFLGENIHKPVFRLWERHNLKKRHISRWLVHSGGKKVIDSIKVNLGLTDYDLRHTLSVLEEYGNISSCSVLFSLKRLSEEGEVREGDLGTLITMGPGASIETALLGW
ncbi:type III polyketide synthase [bacterium]|nr:type III polyketide synthase [bacterium]